jgi:EmrB/QacA subfamily drug resistance transporter
MWLTLLAMTTAASMILVDQTAVPLAVPQAVRDLHGTLGISTWILTANILPLAAFTVLGGRLGDMFGLRRIFLIGAAGFAVSTTAAGLAVGMPMMIAARAAQGCSAALMLPTTMAIVAAAFPSPRRGYALGILAGGSAFFAALGPVLGGVLTTIDWRLVFLINVPLALIAGLIMLAQPEPSKAARDRRRVDIPGAVTLAVALGGLVFGLSQAQVGSWLDGDVLLSVLGGFVVLVIFVVIELRTDEPLVELRLLRHGNFLAANISQVVAGMIELGLGFLLPYYLLLVVGVSPLAAGVALIPATVPIVLAGPLGGRMFDRVGGRWPLVVGFVVLAASGMALGVAAGAASVPALIPGLVLQGIGLGIVLTVNDPTGLTAVSAREQGVAAGMLNTAEQLGGALGIAILTAIELSRYRHDLFASLADKGIHPTPEQIEEGKAFIMQAEQLGLDRAAVQSGESPIVRAALDDLVTAHIHGFALAYYVAAALSVLGAVVSWALVRQQSQTLHWKVRSRRSRWVIAGTERLK